MEERLAARYGFWEAQQMYCKISVTSEAGIGVQLDLGENCFYSVTQNHLCIG